MTVTPQQLRDFLDRHGQAVLVEVTGVKGSTPREAGAWMAVSGTRTIGTIGGGQLEFLAIRHAREMLEAATRGDSMDIPLGPEISQCCGGRVALDFALIDAELRAALDARVAADHAGRPQALVFGAGHVGKALALALSALPYRTLLVDTRAEELASVGEGVETLHTVLPEAEVRAAPPASAFVVLTHEHSLDFLIAREALARGDAAYVGMIGSKTKKATFRSWLADQGEDASLLDRLVTPIGGSGVHDKRPEIIAALTAAEIIAAFSAVEA